MNDQSKLSCHTTTQSEEHFRSEGSLISLNIQDPEKVSWVVQWKDLGVWLSYSLERGLQYKAAYNKASVLLDILRRLFDRFTQDTIPLIVNAHTRSTKEYSVVAWAP